LRGAAGSNALQAFVNFVEARRGEAIPATHATSFVERAEQLAELSIIFLSDC
jgi:hypothetical protein